MDKYNDYMKLALEAAKNTEASQDVPIGAVVVKDGEVIAIGFNEREAYGDSTAHAEIQAIRKACQTLGGWHLDSCELYVTLEPCPMCAGAIINSRLDRVIFGAKDPRMGALGSVMDLNNYPLGHKVEVKEGVLAEESLELLRDFFRDMREGK